jgi:hypothetical protein
MTYCHFNDQVAQLLHNLIIDPQLYHYINDRVTISEESGIGMVAKSRIMGWSCNFDGGKD